MRHVTASKTTLHGLRRALALYERVLPALDLKRRRLAHALANERALVQALVAGRAAIDAHVASDLALLSAPDTLPVPTAWRCVAQGAESVAGVRLPLPAALEFERPAADPLGTPHWLDALAAAAEAAIAVAERVRIAHLRVELLEHAHARTIQRINLIDKVLAPRARADLRRVQVSLGDAERAAVVRAKFAKARHAGRGR